MKKEIRYRNPCSNRDLQGTPCYNGARPRSKYCSRQCKEEHKRILKKTITLTVELPQEDYDLLAKWKSQLEKKGKASTWTATMHEVIQLARKRVNGK